MFRTFTEDFSVQFVDLVFLLSRAPVWRFSLTVRFKCQFIVIIIIIIIIIINMLIKSVELQLSTDNVSFLITFLVHSLVVFFLFVSLSYVVRKIESRVKKSRQIISNESCRVLSLGVSYNVADTPIY